jgi:hypothetical protein
MSDREEFEEFAKDRGLSIGKLPHGDYRLFSTGEAYAAWQAARAQCGQGVEPVAWWNGFGLLTRHEELPVNHRWAKIIPLYTHPQPVVPDKKPLPDLFMASYHEAIGWNACVDAILTAAQSGQGVEPVEFQDYDAGMLNDWGGGNVSWWLDYLRAEIDRANNHWREQTGPLPLYTQSQPPKSKED